jgi:hypothetical protein
VTLMAAVLHPGYNCAHFLCDAWELETGQDIRGIMNGFLAPRRERQVQPAQRHRMERLQRADSPCVVLWRRRGAAPHVGLYVRGAVLHLTDHGVIRQPLRLASIGYHSTRFYAPRPPHS